MLVEEQKTDEAVVDDETQQPPLKEDAKPDAEKPKAEEKSPDKPGVETPTGEELTLDWITKDEEGNYVIKTTNSVFKGKSPEEAIENFRNGYEADQKFIKEMKARSTLKVPSDLFEGKDDVKQPELPVYGEILRAELTKRNIDPRLFAFSDAQWIEYQEEQGVKDWQITRMQAHIEAARKVADDQYDQQTQEVFNLQTVHASKDNVAEMLAEAGIDATDFAPTYYDILKTVYNDPKARGKDGLLVPGKIEAAVGKEISKQFKAKTPLRQELDEKKKEIEKVKTQIKTPVATPKKPDLEKPKPKTISEAAAMARKAISEQRL